VTHKYFLVSIASLCLLWGCGGSGPDQVAPTNEPIIEVSNEGGVLIEGGTQSGPTLIRVVGEVDKQNDIDKAISIIADLPAPTDPEPEVPPVAAPVAISFGPSANTRIPFKTLNGDMFLMDADGSNVVKVGTKGGWPTFNRTYSTLVFSRNGRVIKSSGFGQETDLGPGHGAAISPDGTLIAFTATNSNGTSNRLMLMDSAGNNRREIFSGTMSSSLPSFSPDGTMISFTHFGLTQYQGKDWPRPTVMIYNVAQQTVRDELPIEGWGMKSVFSGDSNQVAFLGGVVGSRQHATYIKNVGEVTLGDLLPTSHHSINFSPDNRFMFHHEKGRGPEPTIFRTSLETGESIPIGAGNLNNGPLY